MTDHLEESNFFDRLAEEVRDRGGRIVKVPPKKGSWEKGARQATRDFFTPKRARYFHGSNLEDVLRRLQASLKPSEEGFIIPRYYGTDTVFWRGQTCWNARKATKTFFEELVRTLAG